MNRIRHNKQGLGISKLTYLALYYPKQFNRVAKLIQDNRIDKAMQILMR